MPKTFVVLPIFNEEKTLLNILRRIGRQADVMICVNDASVDGSGRILENFAKGRKNTFVVNLKTNRGMAGALKAGFYFVLLLASNGRAKDDDIVVTIDADGQHRPEYIPELVKYLVAKKADVVLTRRDFSVYPTYKIWGNRLLTLTSSILSGMKYRDVESGLRLLKVKTLKPILSFYTGVKYSCAQEIALVSARSGFKIDNQFEVRIDYYRPGTTIWDGFIVLALSFLAFGRWFLGLSSKVQFDTPEIRESFERSRSLWRAGKGRR